MAAYSKGHLNVTIVDTETGKKERYKDVLYLAAALPATDTDKIQVFKGQDLISRRRVLLRSGLITEDFKDDETLTLINQSCLDMAHIILNLASRIKEVPLGIGDQILQNLFDMMIKELGVKEKKHG